MKIPGREQIVELFRHRKGLLFNFFFTSLARGALSTGAILLIKEFLSGILGQGGGFAGAAADLFGRQAALWIVAALLTGAYIGGSLLGYANVVIRQHMVKVLELGMMERLIRHLLGLSVPFFFKQSEGDIIQAVRQDVSSLRTVVMSMAGLFVNVCLALGLFVAALSLSARLTFWALIVVPIAVVPIWLAAKRILAQSYKVRRTGYVLFDVILQVLRGIRVIKAFRGEEEEARTATEKGRAYFDELISIVRVRAFAGAILESLASIGIVVVILVGGLDVMRGALEWPALLAFLMAARALHGPLNAINGTIISIQNYGASVARIGELLETRPEVPDRPDGVPLRHGPQRIEFDWVCFEYDDTAVLEDVSFRIEAGQTLGIAGPSGAGKTTLLNLVARFFDPSSGTVKFDGRDLREYRLADVYDKLAIVTQEPFLFATSIRENILCGCPDASDDEVEEAARAAEIHEEIVEMPEKYDTAVGIGGKGLSGGQAQRVNIARAILKNAPILLLDEATSSLDSLSEVNVQRAIDRLMSGRTTFIVAHRLSTLRQAQRILVLDRGRVVGNDSHANLLRDCPSYAHMWETQQMYEPEAPRVSGSPGLTSPVQDVDGLGVVLDNP